MSGKPKPIPNDFVEQYNKKPLNALARLAKHYGSSKRTVKQWMHRCGLKHIKDNESMSSKYGDEILIKDFKTMNIFELREKYCDGVTYKSQKIYANAKRLGLEDRIEIWMAQSRRKKPTPPKEEFDDCYSNLDICKKFNVSFTVSRRWVMELGLTRFNQTLDINKEELQECVNSGMSIKQISVKYNTDPACIKRHLKRNGIEFIFMQDVWSENRKKIQKDIDKIKSRIKSEPVYVIAKEYGVSDGLIRFVLGNNGIDHVPYKPKSQKEIELRTYINDLCGCCESKRWKNNNKTYEIDCFCENHNVGIEYCGLYWHDERNKNRSYHKQKLEWCLKQNISLMTIYDIEYESKQEIIDNMIKVRLGLGKKLMARKCTIRKLDIPTATNFCNKNHINGYHNSSIRYGLYNNDNLVMVMLFAKSRFRNGGEYEIVRMCSLGDCVVVGGASKILKHFIIDFSPKSIMTYADRRFGEGKVYKTLGFDFVGQTQPNYIYWNPSHRTETYSRQKFMKNKLKNIFENYNDSLSEHEIMNMNGYYRIYDCGNNKYLLNLV